MKIETSQLRSYKDAPWSDEHIIYEDEDYVVYKDGFPVTEGHLLFVPKKDIIELDMSVDEAFKLVISTGVVEPNK